MTAQGFKPLVTLTRREWQELRVEDGGLRDDQADSLHGLAVQAARQLRLPETGVLTRTHHGLRAQQVTGILSIPGLTVEILPKIEGKDGAVRTALIRMLAVAYDLRVTEGELSSLQTQRHDLLELLIRLFCERLIAAVRRGLSRQYLELENDLPVFRGSLRVKRQLTIHAARPDRLACRFDELSEDTPINRVLKAAVLRLSPVARTSENLRRLDELASRLEHAGNSARPLAEPVRLDRTNTAFHQVYGLAKMFLSGDWQSTAAGGPSGFSLLFPMNDLFEKYIGRTMKRALSPLPVRLQDRRHFALRHAPAGAGAFSLRPDIVIETGDGPVIVDTKWKRLDAEDVRNRNVSQSDVYQMLAYAHAYDADRLILLYPWDSHLGDPGLLKEWSVNGTKRILQAACVDVGRTDRVFHQLRSLFLQDQNDLPCSAALL
jgi:5-methylcytosine-specific restriction enzyme subunit McrC